LSYEDQIIIPKIYYLIIQVTDKKVCNLRGEYGTSRIYARATDEMKRQAQRKLEKNEDSVFKDNVTFKYTDDEETLKKLSGLK
jgi:hypothetical protein